MVPGAPVVGVETVVDLVMSRYARKQANITLIANKPPRTQRCHTVSLLPFTSRGEDWHDRSMHSRPSKRMLVPQHSLLGRDGVDNLTSHSGHLGGSLGTIEEIVERNRGGTCAARSRRQEI